MDVIADASEAETDEKHLEERETVVYDDLVDLEDVMFETARQTSLRDTTMVGSSRAGTTDVTLVTDASRNGATS